MYFRTAFNSDLSTYSRWFFSYTNSYASSYFIRWYTQESSYVIATVIQPEITTHGLGVKYGDQLFGCIPLEPIMRCPGIALGRPACGSWRLKYLRRFATRSDPNQTLAVKCPLGQMQLFNGSKMFRLHHFCLIYSQDAHLSNGASPVQKPWGPTSCNLAASLKSLHPQGLQNFVQVLGLGSLAQMDDFTCIRLY